MFQAQPLTKKFVLMFFCLKDKRDRRKHEIPVDPAIPVTHVLKNCLYVAYVLMSKKTGATPIMHCAL